MGSATLLILYVTGLILVFHHGIEHLTGGEFDTGSRNPEPAKSSWAPPAPVMSRTAAGVGGGLRHWVCRVGLPVPLLVCAIKLREHRPRRDP